MKTTTSNPLSQRSSAFRYARERALMVGLDVNTADAVAHRCMDLWDPEYAVREWNEFIDQEVMRHAAP